MPLYIYRGKPYTAKDNTNTEMVDIAAGYVPQIVYAIEQQKDVSDWIDTENWFQGYGDLTKIQWGLIMPGSSDIVEAIDRLYRLHDVALNGSQYIEANGVIMPAIPAVPPAEAKDINAGRAHLARLWQLAENAATAAEFDANSTINGTEALDYAGSWRARLEAIQGTQGGFFGIGATPVTLADLLRAGRVNTEDDQGLINDGVQEMLSVISQGGSIADTISGLLGTGAALASDGGLMALQIATAAGQAAAVATQVAAAQRIVKALDGGELGGSGDDSNNMLYWLRRATRDSAGEHDAGQTLVDILEKLDVISQQFAGPNDGGLSLAQQFALLRQQLGALAQLDDLGNPVVGIALAGIQNTLNCICEGVSGAPAAYTWPADPNQPCGSNYPRLALRATAGWKRVDDFNGGYIYQLDLTSWESVGSSNPLLWTYTPDGALIVNATDSDPYQVCVSHQWPNEATSPPVPSGQLNPINVSGGGDGYRATINYNGDPTMANLYRTNNQDPNKMIGYAFALSLPDGNEPPPIRVYIHTGALG